MLALAVAALGAALHQYKIGVPLTNSSHDWLFALRGNIPVGDAVVVFMDEDSHQQLGQPLNAPWDRAVHARLIERLTQAGARAIVMDIVFSDANPDKAAADAALAAAIRKSGRVILGADPKECDAVEPCVIPPFDLLRDAAEDRWGLVQMSPS